MPRYFLSGKPIAFCDRLKNTLPQGTPPRGRRACGFL